MRRLFIVKLSSKGQVVLPKKLREGLGWKTGQEFSVRGEGTRVILEPVHRSEEDWHHWEGLLAGSEVLEGLAQEHRWELEHDR